MIVVMQGNCKVFRYKLKIGAVAWREKVRDTEREIKREKTLG